MSLPAEDPTLGLLDLARAGARGGYLARITALERRIRILEQASPVIQVVSGTPAPAQTPREGTPFADRTNNKLGLWINGAWKSVTVA